ncbi:RING-H2 finger protein ATL2-like [Cucurbita pepo subsp. pepo]|uniref:RING-H2 finger protein ATL2-like n=1 Tax=Cucurbita pepo subsp. pepo TaxID=3664 RepID=UPI000C9D5F6F|nr:RING-H2 finger protein ATL2-like [Cucurbita pepo subsp. pepo]
MAAEDDDDGGGLFSPSSFKSYALSGKIMLGAVIVLLFVVILMICLHLYVRLYLLSSSRRQSRSHRRRRRRRVQFEFTTEPRIAAASSRGLPQSILKSLPVFVHSMKPDPDPVYCAVCLSEFEESEIGRTIPKCNHSFHVGCIDMWFYSHVTCPLCRSEVKPVPGSESGPSNDPVEIVLDVCEPGSRSSEDEPVRECPVEMAASVELVDVELRPVADMSETTTSFVKSLSLKRILSRDATERDLEKEESAAVR